jgi:uncharacterized membrane protein (DUF485 family)
MGVSVSKNEVDSLIKNTQNIISNYENICTLQGNSSQAQFDANGCDFGKGTVINISSSQNINQTCISSGTTKNSIFNSVSQSMRQTAEATTQAFAFPSINLSESYISDSIDLGQGIINHYYNTCIGKAESSKAEFKCTDSKFDGAVINISSYQDITQKCIQDYLNNNGLVSKLQSTISQSDVAKNQSIFTIFLIIFVVLIVVIAYAGISLAESPLVEWGIVILIAISLISTVIYTITAKNNGNYPYNKK